MHLSEAGKVSFLKLLIFFFFPAMLVIVNISVLVKITVITIITSNFILLYLACGDIFQL